jgi:ABC-2 type transport system permease protein
MWASFVAILRKEILHILRDRTTLFVAVTIPILEMLLFGSLDQTVRDLPTVIVDQDHSTASRELIDQLRASRTFAITHITADTHEARKEIVAARARVAVVIPPDFHDNLSRSQPAKILVLIDGSDSTASSQALASINGLVASRNLAEIQRVVDAEPPLSAQPVILFNPAGRTANYIIPGLIAILLQLVATVLAALSIVREREKGTLEQLLVTPVHPLGLTLGKLAPYLVMGFVQMSIILVFMRLIFQVEITGSILLLFSITFFYLFSLLAMGMLISSRARTQAEAMQKAQMLLLPSIFLSGYIFPFSGLPLILQFVGQALPATHMIAITRGIVLRGATAIELWPHIAALLAICAVLVILSVFRLRRLQP